MDFTKGTPQYKLQPIDLFAPDKPKINQRKTSFAKNIVFWKKPLQALSRRQWSGRKSVLAVTKYEVKPAVGVRVNRSSN